MTEKETFQGWCVVELLGHRRLAGHVTEQEIAGAAFLRVDVPEVDDEPAATQFVNPSSVYALTPTTEEIARAVSRTSRPAPVDLWTLRRALHPGQPEVVGVVVGDDDDDDLDDVPF